MFTADKGFTSAVEATARAASKDKSRPALHGMRVEVNNDNDKNVTLWCTDSFRIYQTSIKLESDFSMSGYVDVDAREFADACKAAGKIANHYSVEWLDGGIEITAFTSKIIVPALRSNFPDCYKLMDDNRSGAESPAIINSTYLADVAQAAKKIGAKGVDVHTSDGRPCHFYATSGNLSIELHALIMPIRR